MRLWNWIRDFFFTEESGSDDFDVIPMTQVFGLNFGLTRVRKG